MNIPLPTGYEVSSDGGRRVLTSSSVVYQQTASGPGPVVYRRRPVCRFNSKIPGSAVALIARLDKMSRTSNGKERVEALRRMADVFREWRKDDG